jgi:hypothetical protein
MDLWVGKDMKASYSTYFVKSKLGSKEKDGIPLDQEVHVCG